MTEQPNYAAQVADLITDAFEALRGGMSHRLRTDTREDYLAQCQAQLAAAQACAALAQAQETRTAALVALSAIDPREVPQRGPVAQEAYTAAAVALGLVEDPSQEEADAHQAALLKDFLDEFPAGTDPADVDLGDLK